MGKCGDMQRQFGLFRKTGEAALWVCWRGGFSYIWSMHIVLVAASGLSICHHACLPHPSTFQGVLQRLWAAAWKEGSVL